MGEFDDLNTVQFQKKMKPAAIGIYSTLFPGCEFDDLRLDGVKVHILDQEFGIDGLLRFPSGQWVSIQEKYRRNKFIKYCDFTQEYMNASGTIHESTGEWFKLGAQLYFYGWANVGETEFEKWFLMDIAKYKILVAEAGGIENVGKLRQNNYHGRASFYAIPIATIEPAFITDYRRQQ